MSRTAKPVPDGPRRTHTDQLRTFDHRELTELPGYPELREALYGIASHADEARLTALVEAAQDMASTAPLGDWCPLCQQQPAWPHGAIRRGNAMTAKYRCAACEKTWTRVYAIAGSMLVRSRRQRPDNEDGPTTTTTAEDQR